MEPERRVVLVVQGLFMSGELPGGTTLEDALKAETVVLEEVHFASLPGVNIPKMTVLTSTINAYGLGNHPTRAAGHEYHTRIHQKEVDRKDMQATEYENIP